MYSRLDPVFQTLPRQAENADTRQHIHREEKTDEEKHKGKKDGGEQAQDMWEDSTIVSIRALRAFLSGLVGGSENAGQSASAHVDVQAPAPENVKESPAPVAHDAHAMEAAKAARAYKVMYYTGQKEHQPPLPAPPASASAIKLSPEEERMIHRLMTDVDILAARGIETLQIRKSDSFLQSLIEAVSAAL